MGWPFTSGSSSITLGEKDPVLLGPYISSFCLLPGCLIHDPILLALQLPHTKAKWPPMDKSCYPPNCSIPPLWWMLSSGHWCETKRIAHFIPALIGLNSCFFSRTLCLGKVFQSCSFKSIGEPTNHLSLCNSLCVFFSQVTYSSTPGWWPSIFCLKIFQHPSPRMFSQYLLVHIR